MPRAVHRVIATRRARIAIGAATLVAFGAPAVASAQSADRIEAHTRFDDADFVAAGAAFERVLVDPAASAADRLDAHRYLAVVTHASGGPGAARPHIAAVVAADPSIAAPSEAPPPLAVLWRELQLGHARTASRVVLVVEVAPRPLGVRAIVSSLPDGIGLQLTVRCERDGREVAGFSAAARAGATSVPFDAGNYATMTRCQASIAAESGEVLQTAAVVVASRNMFSAPSVSIGAGQGVRRGHAGWIALGAGGGGLLLGAVIVGIVLATVPPATGVPLGSFAVRD